MPRQSIMRLFKMSQIPLSPFELAICCRPLILSLSMIYINRNMALEKLMFFSCASISGQEFLVRGWRSCPLLPLSVWTPFQLGWTHGDPLPAPIDSVSLYMCHSVVSRRPCFLGLFPSHCLFQSFYYCLDKVLWALKGEVVETFLLALSIPRLFILCSLSSNRSHTCLCLLQVEDSWMMTMQDTDLRTK